jgi:hypothetical protein
VQAAKARTHRRLLLGKLDGDLAREHVPAGQRKPLHQLEEQPRAEEVPDALGDLHLQWKRPAKRVCIIAPMKTIQTSVTGMNTFQPSRMI